MSDYIIFDNANIQLIDGDRGKNYPKQSEFLENGYCLFLSAKNVTSDGFNFDDCTFISCEKDNILRAGKLQTNDIVITTRGTIGNVAFFTPKIQKEFENIRINSGMLILRVDPSRWNIRFIYLYLTSKLFKNQVESLISGSAVPQLPVKDIKRLKIPNLGREKQDEIVSIIGSIDDKIQLNNETNKTLENIAQAIFKSWFIDFDPVKAKANAFAQGRDETTANRHAMQTISGKTESELTELEQTNPKAFAELKTTAESFPSAFDDNGLPLGWEMKKLSDFALFSNGYSFKSKELIRDKELGTHKVFKMGNIKKGGGFNIDGSKDYFDLNSNPKAKKALAQKGDILMCMTDMKNNVALLGHTALMPTSNQYLINQRVGIIRKSENSYINYPFIYFFTNEENFISELRSRANSGVQVNLSTQAIKDSLALIPSEKVHYYFDKQVMMYLEKIIVNNEESQNLMKIRDILLPKLLSGEIEL